MGSTGDSEKIIQRLNDELREAQERANTEKHKYLELQGDIKKIFDAKFCTVLNIVFTHAHKYIKYMSLYFAGILEEERKETKQQADESAKQIKLLQGIFLCCRKPPDLACSLWIN